MKHIIMMFGDQNTMFEERSISRDIGFISGIRYGTARRVVRPVRVGCEVAGRSCSPASFGTPETRTARQG